MDVIVTLSITSALWSTLYFAFAPMVEDRDEVCKIALLAAGVQWLLGLWTASIYYDVDQRVYTIPCFTFYFIDYHLSVDGFSIWFIALSPMLTYLCALIGVTSVKFRAREFYALLFLTHFLLLNVFMADNLLHFYISFEALVIPMYLFIGVWGSRQRRVQAGYYLLFYTLISSVLMLSGIAYLYLLQGSTDILALHCLGMYGSDQEKLLVFLAVFLSMATKMPIFPFHLWLPEAHVEAPTIGSILLAGILLKVGGYGYVRFLLPFFTDTITELQPYLQTLVVLTSLYGFGSAIAQVDMKKVIAYSSIGHMAFVLAGLLSYSLDGVVGALYTMVTHAFASCGLFAVVGFLYDRYGTRHIYGYGGLAMLMPYAATLSFLLLMGNVGFPGTGSFVAEILVSMGAFKISGWLSLWLLITTVIGVAYNFYLYIRVFFGPTNEDIKVYVDFSERERAVLVTLVFFNVLAGIDPSVFLDVVEPYAQDILLLAKFHKS